MINHNNDGSRIRYNLRQKAEVSITSKFLTNTFDRSKVTSFSAFFDSKYRHHCISFKMSPETLLRCYEVKFSVSFPSTCNLVLF